MSDLIDRQKAINVIERMRAHIGHNMERAVGAAFIEILDDVGEDIGRLPSIQFATDTNVGNKLVIDPHKIERAIRGLTEWQKHVQTESDIDRDISVAVEALKAQLGTNLAQLGTDLISRQMLLEYIHGEPVGRLLCDKYNLDGLIEQMPSAQPEIIRCKDCKHHWTYKSMDRMPIERCDLEQTFYDAEHDFCSLAERREVTT